MFVASCAENVSQDGNACEIVAWKQNFMTNHDADEIRDLWDRLADDWHIQVGTDGDRNRLLNSDPVLWRFAGDVGGLKVLDAGCGTGYLSNHLHDRGAVVTGVDISGRMIAIARRLHPGL